MENRELPRKCLNRIADFDDKILFFAQDASNSLFTKVVGMLRAPWNRGEA